MAVEGSKNESERPVDLDLVEREGASPGQVRDLTANDHCVAIVRAVASLGKSMGMITTAEGVETHEQIALVRELGRGEAQGYLFGKPQAVTSVSALLHDRLAVVA